MALKSFDADRYAAINLPNDGYSNAIFSQAGAAIRQQSALLFGKCMPVHTMLGAGQSQSSFRLASYLTSAQPNDQVYDGLILHSGLEAQNNDPPVPVFEIFTMTEGNRALSDGPNLVKWVVAGATHSDETLATVGLEAGADLGAGTFMAAMCVNPQNDFPAFRAYDAAFDWMNRWLKKGEKPPRGMQLGSMNDDNGNVTGGAGRPMRCRCVDVRVRWLHGSQNGGHASRRNEWRRHRDPVPAQVRRAAGVGRWFVRRRFLRHFQSRGCDVRRAVDQGSVFDRAS